MKAIIYVLCLSTLIVSPCVAQSIHFNSDGTIDKLVYNENKSAHELFESSMIWLNKTYLRPQIVSTVDTDKTININAEIYRVLYDDKTNNWYNASYNMLIEFNQGGYQVTLTHKDFLIDDSVTYYPLKSILNGKQKEKYELKLTSIVNSLNSYIKTGKFPNKDE